MKFIERLLDIDLEDVIYAGLMVSFVVSTIALVALGVTLVMYIAYAIGCVL